MKELFPRAGLHKVARMKQATMENGPEESLKQTMFPWCLSPGRDNMLIKILIK